MNVPPPMNPPPYEPPQAPLSNASSSIPTHLVWSIVVTVLSLCLCCIVGTIPGIVAIVFSTKVKSSLDAGDIAGAQQASNTAKIWAWVTTGLCIVGLLWTAFSLMTGGMGQYTQMIEQIQQQSGR
jgi:heme/copper-type cytochrome/quinol oxidase subunit 2